MELPWVRSSAQKRKKKMELPEGIVGEKKWNYQTGWFTGLKSANVTKKTVKEQKDQIYPQRNQNRFILHEEKNKP